MEYKYTGIILNKRDVGETDRIYTFYTLEGGKIKTLAKGVRKPHAKLAASLENITLADLTIMRTRGLGKVTGSIVEHNFSALKKDAQALLETFVALGTFDRLVDFENPDQQVFELLKKYLEAVNSCCEQQEFEKMETLRLGFTVKLLDVLGYSIEVSSCVICSSPLSQDAVAFSSRHGGVICSGCAEQNMGATLPIRANAIKMLRLFLQNNMHTLAKISAAQEDCQNVHLVVDDFLRWNT